MTSSTDAHYIDPPTMKALPKYGWVLRVYGLDSFGRLKEIKAQITSVLGRFLKMDSTKKVSEHILFWIFENCFVS